ncbi:MAG: nitrilase-related carbon-nitrogen hydrolase [Polyangiaceae bacterium]
MTRLKVAVAQVAASVDDLDANFDKHLDYIARARAEGVELLVFPELSLTGYPSDAVEVDRLARHMNQDRIAELARAAEGLFVVAGHVEEAAAAQFYNTSVVVRDGKVVYWHRKLNLATYGELHEGRLFATGRHVQAFSVTGPWRGGLLICADAWNPALVTLTALHGATVLLVPTASARDAVSSEFSSVHGWHVVVEFYALVYGMPVIMANLVGAARSLRFWGGSRIVDPFGKPLAVAAHDEETLLLAELDYDEVRKARLQLPTVRDSNLALIEREVTRLQNLLGVPDLIRKA